VSVSLDSEIFSEGKKCRESNIGGSDNIGAEGKIVGGAIGACDGIVARRTCLDGKSKVIIVKVLPLFSITMALIPMCNTPILTNIAAEANLSITS
nr:hypothetical protein [Tanacetum cinerariifolium]